MILLILDILIYNFTAYNSYFFLLSILFYRDKDYMKILFIGLILDLIILNKLFINTFILLLIFIINKRIFKLKNKNLKSYLLITNFNFLLYNILLSLIYSFNLKVFSMSFIINIIFYLLSYNLVKKYIKLSRWLNLDNEILVIKNRIKNKRTNHIEENNDNSSNKV